MVVEVGEVLGQCVCEVAVVENQYPVQQLAVERFDPALSGRVRLRCSHWRAEDVDALTGEHGVEDAGDLRSRSRIKSVKLATRSPRSISRFRAC